VKVGVVGCGRIATAVHMPSLKQIQGYELVAASDLNPARLEEVKDKFGVKETYDDYRTMLVKEDLDAVFVCTPPEQHFQVVMDALEWGKHVLCEKPLSSTVEEALTVKKAYEMQSKGDEPLFLMPAHNFVFTPCFVEALRRMEDGEVGKIKKIDACITTNLQFYGAKTDFRNQAKCGVLEDLFPHLIYLVQRVGGPLEKVSCIEPVLKGGIVSVVNVRGRLKHGAEADLTAKWTGFVPTLQFDLIGENGEIRMNLLRTPYNMTVKKNGETETMIMGPRLRQYIDVIRFKHPSYINEHQHFLKCADGEAQPQVSVNDGIELVRTLNAVTECFQGSTYDSSTQRDTAVVLRENGATIEATVQKAVEMLGGFKEIGRDDLVLVKPNVCSPKNPDGMVITDPKLLEAVLRLVKKKSSNVLVVESDSASGTAEKKILNTGFMDVIKKCDVEFFNLTKDYVEEHKVAGLTFAIPKTALRADYIINIPKFKTNMDVGLSIAMKNMFGFVAPRKKTYLHPRLADVIVYLNKVIRQDMIITDGIVAMEGLGPVLGSKVDLGLIVAGRNAITVDAACCYIAGFNPYAVEPLWKAHQQNMGEIDPQKIQFLGEDVNSVKRNLSSARMSKANIIEAVKTELRTRLR